MKNSFYSVFLSALNPLFYVRDSEAWRLWWDRRTLAFYRTIRQAVGPVVEAPPPPPGETFHTVLLVLAHQRAVAELDVAARRVDETELALREHLLGVVTAIDE